MKTAEYTIVTGATSVVARYILPHLCRMGARVRAVSRGPRPPGVPEGVEWVQADMTADAADWWIAGGRLIHLAPVSLLAAKLEVLANVRHIIAFSTTSIETKASSSDPVERAMVADLHHSEQDIVNWAEARRIPLHILRPTMIYDGVHDQNVARLRWFVRRFGFLAVAGAARGLRQPVHADDLAMFCAMLLHSPPVRARVLNVCGGETLTYVEMARRIFSAEGRRTRIVHLPVPLLRAAVKLATRTRLLHGLSPAAVDRMNVDLAFDCSEALEMGFRPRPFQPVPLRGEHHAD